MESHREKENDLGFVDEETNHLTSVLPGQIDDSVEALKLTEVQTYELRPFRTVQPELEETYERLVIQTELAPPVRPVPHRFQPIVKKRKLATMLFREFWRVFTGNLVQEKDMSLMSRWKALVDRPCRYDAYSGRLGGFKPIPEKCTGCMRCTIEHPGIIEDVVVNEEFENLKLSGLKSEEVEVLYYEALNGKERVSGTGYKGPFAGPGWDSIWLDMSEIVRPTRDGKGGREYIATASDIGSKPRHLKGGVLKVLTVQLPIVFDCQPEGSTSGTLQLAIAEAARRCGTLSLVSHRHYTALRGEYSDYLGLVLRGDDIEHLENLNIKPRPRVIEVESVLREDFETVKAFSPSSIVIARLKADKKVREHVGGLLEYEVDGFHILADQSGYEFLSQAKATRHVKDVVRDINHFLLREGVRSETTLLGSGGMYLAEHVPKAIGCGLDIVAIDLTVHIALQSEFRMENHHRIITPTITDHNWGAQRLTNVMAAWHAQLIEAMSAMGKRDVRRLTGDEGRLIFYEDMRREAFCDIEKVVDNA